MWDAIRNICATCYNIHRTVPSIRSFWMRAQVQCQKWLDASKTVSRVLLKSSGHAPTEVDLVTATQKTWRENMALTSFTAVKNIGDLKYIDKAQYLGQ